MILTAHPLDARVQWPRLPPRNDQKGKYSEKANDPSGQGQTLRQSCRESDVTENPKRRAGRGEQSRKDRKRRIRSIGLRPTSVDGGQDSQSQTPFAEKENRRREQEGARADSPPERTARRQDDREQNEQIPSIRPRGGGVA